MSEAKLREMMRSLKTRMCVECCEETIDEMLDAYCAIEMVLKTGSPDPFELHPGRGVTVDDCLARAYNLLHPGDAVADKRAE